MACVVAEALRAKAARREGAAFESELLGHKAVEDREGLGVRWEEYEEGGELRLEGHAGRAFSIVACDEWMCSGSDDGSIRVWSRATGEPERALQADDSDGGVPAKVQALAVWGGRLISGHQCGRLRVWDVATAECGQVLAGHAQAVRSLAVWGSRLASGSDDGSIKLWAMAAGAPWACERELLGRTGGVWALAGWGDRLASGSSDGSMRVWDAGTGAIVAALAGHSGAVWALVVHGDRLLSASRDGTIRAWALGTWAGLRTVEVYGRRTPMFRSCLAVRGSKLVSGTAVLVKEAQVWSVQADVRVWGLAELDLQQALRQPTKVDALAAVDGEVWACVGKEVVVWGRRRRGVGPVGRTTPWPRT